MNAPTKPQWGRIRAYYQGHEQALLTERADRWALDPYEWAIDAGITLTPIEEALWHDLRQAGVVMYPQYPVGRFFVDFANPKAKVVYIAPLKALVRAFVTEVLVNGQGERLAHYIDADRYTQHNPAVGDGVPALVSALQAMAQAGTPMTFTRLHAVLGEGNWVLTVSEGTMLGRHVAFYDLFRVDNGKIVEHWDTIEAIPPSSEWKNANGKFGF